MFVKIDNCKMNIPQVTKWIMETRDDNGGNISPDLAMKILEKTNHFGHIKMVLKSINEKCSDEEKKKYKDFVLSCVDEREMSDVALSYLREMADLCGCRDELEKANDKPKFYEKTDCDNVRIVVSREEFDALEGKNLKVYFDVDNICLSHKDFIKFKEIIFKCGAEVELSHVTNLPENFDVSKCSKVYLYSTEELPRSLDFSGCSKVSFEHSNLINVQNLKFSENAVVNLSNTRNLPANLDVSMCSRVSFGGSDLNNIKELKLRDEVVIDFDRSSNLPENLDVSMCSRVSLNYCDLSEVKELKFREGAIVYLTGARNLPENLDVSMCSHVSLSFCNLSKVKELKFREGASVHLSEARNLPEKLDLSMCDNVIFHECDLKGVKEIKFKDQKQEEYLLCLGVNFSGRVVCELKENNSPGVSHDAGMDM